ncbi:unnamed protein product [Vitrella brassicaformis CCMP3155]|uniref:Uncharacterized protein n=1 Tax=Vitrella brassicaformis (strain CCMP3155) TaxID=1169540 RepID=A0A0G4E9D2_VITBC|nr:unnamed protein product [Vitrella brassicaformis CCMP3155]|eukprot:CEL91986.1 unnamed protein product [Vitrella brassicaformis CCMP3155]
MLHLYRRNDLAKDWCKWIGPFWEEEREVRGADGQMCRQHIGAMANAALAELHADGVATMERNNPAAEAIWMGERSVVFNYAVTLHNVLLSERWEQYLGRLGAWADKFNLQPHDGATEEQKKDYAKGPGLYRSMQDALTSLSWRDTFDRISEPSGHPKMEDGRRHLHDRTKEEGLWWLGDVIRRLEAICAAALRFLPSERCTLGDMEADLSAAIDDLEGAKAIIESGIPPAGSPAAAPSLPSTAASPDQPLAAPPPSKAWSLLAPLVPFLGLPTDREDGEADADMFEYGRGRGRDPVRAGG